MACKELGILPEELFYENLDEFLEKHPGMRYLSKQALKIRFNNINIYRKKLIEAAKNKRGQLLENKSLSTNIKNVNNINNIKLINDFEKDIHTIEDRDKREIEKYKQRQKNIIDVQIEDELKLELLKYQRDIKESLNKDMIDKIKEERRKKIEFDEIKEKEKELMREKLHQMRLKEQEKKKNIILKLEEQRTKNFQTMQEKNKNELFNRNTLRSLSIEQKKRMRLKKIKDEEIKNKKKEEKNILKEKQRQEELEKKKIEIINNGIKRKIESDKKVEQNKIKIELSITRKKNDLNKKDKLTQERIIDLMEKKHKTLEGQRERFQKKLEFIRTALKKSDENIKERNKKILEHQEHVSDIVLQQEILKNLKILERAKSQNDLYLKSIVKRDMNMQKMIDRFEVIKNKSQKIDKKIILDKNNKIENLTLKQESYFIKQYENNHTLVRLNRINSYRNKQRAEQLSEKEKNFELFKNKKQKLKEDKFRKTSSIQNEKKIIINKFENVLNKSRIVNSDTIKKLFPDDLKLYYKIRDLEEKIQKKNYIDYSLRNTSINNYATNIKTDEFAFLTQRKNVSDIKDN